MRVALISDLDGNMVALRAVLDRIAQSGVDRVVCLGDVATLGPAPARVIETLAESAARASSAITTSSWSMPT
jgi:predicted phosphodiesterase